jgi:DNA-binding transcriptional ArsR family regulator
MTDPGVIFGALADDTRRAVFVRVAAGGQATASELARELPVSRQAVAKHLSLLASAGLVESERVGRETRFHARGEPLHDAIDWMARVGARWDERLALLAALASS